jgi:predicted nucleotidyltransferase component of viral defense system
MNEIIQSRLASYKTANPIEQENATKEILQEIALYALWRAKFFEVAAFQGGTSLRILHKLPRFSEDLDFMLIKPDPAFDWQPYLQSLAATFEEYGLQPEAVSKERMDARIRRAVIKDNSIANQLNLTFADNDVRRKLRIKLEIDVEPPAHSVDEYSYLDFPVDYEVRHQDLASNCALKIHALLCREYLKGRDWFDFAWYVAKGVSPNLPHLEAALQQFGPWSSSPALSIDHNWLSEALGEKIASINWEDAKADVKPFLKGPEAESLELWSERFFRAKLDKLSAYSQRT